MACLGLILLTRITEKDMPTSQSEAEVIMGIARQYLSATDAAELFIRLDEQVGQRTANESLKVSLAMLKGLVTLGLPPPPAAGPKPEASGGWAWLTAFYLLVSIHLALIVGVVTSFFLLPFMQPWYVALPLDVFIFNLNFSREECQLTRLENYIRRKLGKKVIGGFIGHYFIKRIWRKKHTKSA